MPILDSGVFTGVSHRTVSVEHIPALQSIA